MIQSHRELRTLTTLADFCLALPIVSATLSSALIASPILQWTPPTNGGTFWKASTLVHDVDEVLVLTYKLRYSLHFKQAFTWVIGQYQIFEVRAKDKVSAGSLSQHILHPDLDPLLENAQATVCAKVLIATLKFMTAWVPGTWNPQISQHVLREAPRRDGRIDLSADMWMVVK